MSQQEMFWALAIASALVALSAGLAERSRNRRRDLDKPGWMPWTMIQVIAMILALVGIALALTR